MYKTGLGYDIHKLVKNRPFILGGVKIPFKKGFLAHSDGDVLIHSIIDAMFGAINAGDIGTHFPDNDPNYKGIDSSILLNRAIELLQTKQFDIVNIDSTIVCQKPKLQPFIPNIKGSLSSIMQLTEDLISIKAKSKEGVDSVGKGKAVEVFTIVMVKNI